MCSLCSSRHVQNELQGGLPLRMMDCTIGSVRGLLLATVARCFVGLFSSPPSLSTRYGSIAGMWITYISPSNSNISYIYWGWRRVDKVGILAKMVGIECVMYECEVFCCVVSCDTCDMWRSSSDGGNWMRSRWTPTRYKFINQLRHWITGRMVIACYTCGKCSTKTLRIWRGSWHSRDFMNEVRGNTDDYVTSYYKRDKLQY